MLETVTFASMKLLVFIQNLQITCSVNEPVTSVFLGFGLFVYSLEEVAISRLVTRPASFCRFNCSDIDRWHSSSCHITKHTVGVKVICKLEKRMA